MKDENGIQDKFRVHGFHTDNVIEIVLIIRYLNFVECSAEKQLFRLLLASRRNVEFFLHFIHKLLVNV